MTNELGDYIMSKSNKNFEIELNENTVILHKIQILIEFVYGILLRILANGNLERLHYMAKIDGL